MNKYVSEHLTKEEKTNNGSFYTPLKIVKIAENWLHEEGIESSFTFIDSSCGCGAFFALSETFKNNKFIGNDIDNEAIDYVRQNFQLVKTYSCNALVNISREMFGLDKNEKNNNDWKSSIQ